MVRYFLTYIKPNGKELRFRKFKQLHDNYRSITEIRNIAYAVHKDRSDLKIICKSAYFGYVPEGQSMFRTVFEIQPTKL